MNDTERLQLIRDLCSFWQHEMNINSDLRWNSMVWAQVLMDMVGPIAEWKSTYTISLAHKSLRILKKKEPNLYYRVKPFLNMKGYI